MTKGKEKEWYLLCGYSERVAEGLAREEEKWV